MGQLVVVFSPLANARFLLDDGLLDAALEQALPGSTVLYSLVTKQNMSVKMADPYYQDGAGEPEENTQRVPVSSNEPLIFEERLYIVYIRQFNHSTHLHLNRTRYRYIHFTSAVRASSSQPHTE